MHRVLNNTNNACPCTIGYYDDQDNNTLCQSCHYSCHTCDWNT